MHLILPSSFQRSSIPFTTVTKPSFEYHHFLRCSSLLVLLFIYLFGLLKSQQQSLSCKQISHESYNQNKQR